MLIYHQSDNSVSNVYHTVRFRNWQVRLHFHRGYELIHVMEGQVELTVDGRKELLDTGDFALILSNQVHRLQTLGESLIWICGFSTDFLPQFHKSVRNKIGSKSAFRCADSIYDFLKGNILFGEKYAGRRQDPYQLRGALNILCGDYLRSVQLADRDNSQFELMNTISDYIEKNYQRKLTLQDVAAVLGYDYSYFSRLFRKVFSVPFPEYLNNYRCSAAVEMIRNTDYSLASIAEKSGFQSIRTFNSVFLRNVGMTPSQYLKRIKKQA